MLLRTVEEEMQRMREHFEGVLNHGEPPNPSEAPVGPSDELNIRISCVTCYAIKKAMKRLKGSRVRQYRTRGKDGWSEVSCTACGGFNLVFWCKYTD